MEGDKVNGLKLTQRVWLAKYFDDEDLQKLAERFTEQALNIFIPDVMNTFSVEKKTLKHWKVIHSNMNHSTCKLVNAIFLPSQEMNWRKLDLIVEVISLLRT